jgi:hypothetical protein
MHNNDQPRPYRIEDSSLFHYDSENRPHRVCGLDQEIAVAYDCVDGILHKHGEASLVAGWFDETVTKIRKTGYAALADSLVLVRMSASPECVSELNDCVEITGRVLGIDERMASLSVVHGPS